MTAEPTDFSVLAQFVLPQGVLDYFRISKLEQTKETISIYLEELNIVPEDYASDKLVSKGFYEEIKVQDYPLRGKSVYLMIRRRRWFNETTGVIVMRNWDLVAKGTRMTQEFASFLKAISGYPSDKL